MKSTHLSFGAGMGLAHMQCAKCKKETLHRQNICVHCGSAIETRIDDDTQWRKSITSQTAVNKALKAKRRVPS